MTRVRYAAPEDQHLEQKHRFASLPDHTRGDVVDQDEAEEDVSDFAT